MWRYLLHYAPSKAVASLDVFWVIEGAEFTSSTRYAEIENYTKQLLIDKNNNPKEVHDTRFVWSKKRAPDAAWNRVEHNPRAIPRLADHRRIVPDSEKY